MSVLVFTFGWVLGMGMMVFGFRYAEAIVTRSPVLAVTQTTHKKHWAVAYANICLGAIVSLAVLAYFARNTIEDHGLYGIFFLLLVALDAIMLISSIGMLKNARSKG